MKMPHPSQSLAAFPNGNIWGGGGLIYCLPTPASLSKLIMVLGPYPNTYHQPRWLRITVANPQKRGRGWPTRTLGPLSPKSLSALSILSIAWYEPALHLPARIFPSCYFCAHNLCQPLGPINP